MYLSNKTILESINLLKGITEDRFWGFLALVAGRDDIGTIGCTGCEFKVTSNKPAIHLNNWFAFNETSGAPSSTETYILLSDKWYDNINLLLKTTREITKLPPLDAAAIFFFQSRNFTSEVAIDELKKLFLKKLNITIDAAGKIFSEVNSNIIVSYNEISDRDKIFAEEDFYKSENLYIKSDFHTIITSRPSNFGQAPFIQTLYSNTSLPPLLLISKVSIKDIYFKNSSSLTNKYTTALHRFSNLPKPFLLLAGISGTGKSRFVREQAKAAHSGANTIERTNFCMVSVRPDWHEPSELLGYVSRLGTDGPQYIVTDFLKFIVTAWLNATDANANIKVPSEMTPHWLCLDEMNLAPVEQYFADYLSVIETRNWSEGNYMCDPLLQAKALAALSEDARKKLYKDLFGQAWTEDFSQEKSLFEKFTNPNSEWRGIPVPPNLIVAGTVNMDETTHGFSRKVIDRALTLDFQEFFPNDFKAYIEDNQVKPITLGFPTQSSIGPENIEASLACTGDPSGSETVSFMNQLNGILNDTPFQLAYRALNECLLAVSCLGSNPSNDSDVAAEAEAAPSRPSLRLQAVWDDFLMQKVLPRIEGDTAKLSLPSENEQDSEATLPRKDYGRGTILHALHRLLREKLLEDIWEGKKRPDLLRDTSSLIECRSRKKLEWMMHRLKNNHFTDFWC